MSESSSEQVGAALVLAFDSPMFGQAQRCVETIQAHCRRAYQICAVAIDLPPDEVAWLRGEGIKVFEDWRSIPCYADGPRYARAMTCRPYLPRLFPGHQIYMSIDADLRFEHADGFEFYLAHAEALADSIVICQEVDTAYPIMRFAKKANHYFGTRYHRIAKAFGQETATRLQFFIGFNAGIFAMHAKSRGWESYRRKLEISMKGAFEHLAEQDAMNVAIVEDELEVVVAPTIMNWLCLMAMPMFDTQLGRWVRPAYPRLPISVLHLNKSSAEVPGEPPGTTQYQIYQRLKLTK